MYLAMDFFHFANEDDEKGFEDAVKAFKEHMLFAGRVVQDPDRKLTHCMVWKFEDFEDYDNNWRAYAATLNEDGSNGMDWPAYRADHWWGCKVIDLEDPILLEFGPEEWSRQNLQGHIDTCKEDVRVANWQNSLFWWSVNQGDRPHRCAEWWVREQAGLPFKEY